jgi:hypothetical protein
MTKIQLQVKYFLIQNFLNIPKYPFKKISREKSFFNPIFSQHPRSAAEVAGGPGPRAAEREQQPSAAESTTCQADLVDKRFASSIPSHFTHAPSTGRTSCSKELLCEYSIRQLRGSGRCLVLLRLRSQQRRNNVWRKP